MSFNFGSPASNVPAWNAPIPPASTTLPTTPQPSSTTPSLSAEATVVQVSQPFSSSQPFTFSSQFSHQPPQHVESASTLIFGALGDQQQQQHLQQFNPNSMERVSLKKAHGVGNTGQWRDRLKTRIEEKIKGVRESQQNSRRQGLFATPTSIPISLPLSSAISSTNTSFQYQQQQHAAERNELDELSEDERLFIVRQEWEAFKAENMKEFEQAFEGWTDLDFENLQQEIVADAYAYDPDYDRMMDMEQDEVEELMLQHYLGDEIPSHQQPTTATAVNPLHSLQTIQMLQESACFQCQAGPLIAVPSPTSLSSMSATSSSASDPSSTTTPVVMTCHQCGFNLQPAMIEYITQTAVEHAAHCQEGKIRMAFDVDTGLLMDCSHCDLLA